MPARLAARPMAFCTDASLRWWRYTLPVRGSAERVTLGNTHCQPHCLGAPGYLASSALGQQDCPEAFRQIPQMQCTRLGDLFLQRQDQVLGQDRHPVLAAFAVPNQDLAPREFNVLDTKAQALEQAHACPVQQRAHQADAAIHLVQHSADFGHRQDDRQPARVGRGHHLVEPGQGPCSTPPGTRTGWPTWPAPGWTGRPTVQRPGGSGRLPLRMHPWCLGAACH